MLRSSLSLSVCALLAATLWSSSGAHAQTATTRPPLAFAETWKKPYTGPVTDANRDEVRRVTSQALTQPGLELHLYGPDARSVLVTEHEGREDLWTGLATSPVAVTLKDTANYLDLTGLARLRWMVRTEGLHVIFPVVKLADGTLLAGHRGVSTDGDFLQTEVAYSGMRWYKLDPDRVVTTAEVTSPALNRVDEVGWTDLMPGGGKGNAGWCNVSTMELYAKRVPR